MAALFRMRFGVCSLPWMLLSSWCCVWQCLALSSALGSSKEAWWCLLVPTAAALVFEMEVRQDTFYSWCLMNSFAFSFVVVT